MNKKRFALHIILLTFALLFIGHGREASAAGKNVVTIKVTALGDCTLGKNYKMAYKNSWGDTFEKKGADYFLSGVTSYTENDDLTIANLEGALTNNGSRLKKFYKDRTGEITEKDYSHLGKPEYIKALTSGGVDAVSFANNHNLDYGLAGFKDTVNACRNNDMPIAYYDNLVRLEVKGMTVGIISIDTTYCSNDTAEEYLRDGMADLRRDCDLIIACMHWGENYKTSPDKTQKRFAHLCINLGADMVIGNHAHILQGVERYRGRYIFYSLGNFTYGGRAVPKDVDTMMAQQTFTFVNGKLQIDDNVQIIPCWMSSSKKVNKFNPVVKTGSAAAEIIKKVNSRSESLGVKFNRKGKVINGKAARTKLPVCSDTYTKRKVKKVPDVILKMLRLKS